ncbi:MAG: hypothetical protein L0Y64_26110 [Myxococcaceae bacterium]|nr:hypothetical protein [Myxococcaceae bacterium]
MNSEEAVAAGLLAPRIVPDEALHPPEYFPTLRPSSVAGRYASDESKFLAAMREPLLWWSPDAEESYRLLWLRSFEPAVAFRLERTDTGGILVVTELRGVHDLRVRRSASVDVGPLEWALLEANLAASGFWSAAPPRRRSDWTNTRDGTFFVFEGRRGVAYRAIELHSTDIGSLGTPNAQRIMALREAWLLLMSLSPHLVRPEQVY